MFDLIDESGQDLKRYGYTVRQLERYGISVASLIVKNDKESEKIGLDKAEYYIFNSPFIHELGFENSAYLISLISSCLKKIFRNLKLTKASRFLIVGLGNPDIDADKLGKIVFDEIEIKPLEKSNNIFKFCPNIFFSTGIDTLDMVKLFARHLKIDCAIIIDSLTTSSMERLGKSFQITTSGMTPGSGVNRFGSRINKKSIGAECISIGVPFMIFSSSLNENKEFEMILSPKDIKENVERAGFIIGRAIMEILKWITIYLSHFS